MLSAIVIAAAAPVAAQTAPAAQAEPEGQAAIQVEDVVVTGTRLRLPGEYTQPNPVVSMSSENLQQSGVTNLADFLRDVPSLVSSLSLEGGADTSTPGLVGLNLLDLRNMGTVRTLTLVNGRRHVAANPGTTAVDTNTIPQALIDRIEILTGGASAVYGADGVSGVVNFILKEDFEGVDFRTQYGWADAGVGNDVLVSGLVGHNFLDGRANLTFAVEHQYSEDVKFNDRSFTRAGQRYTLWRDPNPAAIYEYAPLNDVRYIDTSPGGSIYTNFATAPTLSGVSFLGDGSPFVDGVYLGGFSMQGGSGSLTDWFNDDLLPGFERLTLNSTGKFELSSQAELFAELKYNRTRSDFRAQPSYDYGLFIDIDNPYLPAVARADALTPGGLGLSIGGVLLARDNFDFGTQSYEVERETWRGVFGLRGEINPHLSYEASFNYGKTRQEIYAYNIRLNDRYFAATDVVMGPNGPTCRSNLTPGAAPVGDLFGQFPFDPAYHGATFTPGGASGCLPINPFGENRNSPEAIAWFMTNATQVSELQQTVFNAFVAGDTTPLFSLPAGPIGYVLGVEYRKEESDYVPSDIEALAENLEYPISTLGRGVRTLGEFDVREAFTELSVPVLRDVPFVRELTLEGAYRFSDYSTSGQTDTWNINGRWRLNDSLMVRATRARAARAPNINNLFAGNVQTFAALSDPCAYYNQILGENPSARQANCATDLTALGLNPATFDNTSSESIGGFLAGNPDLQPEEADTNTIGLVFTPTFVRGLYVSVDYFDVEISDAIQSYSAQTIVNNCYDIARPNPFCDLIERGTSGGAAGRIVSFRQVPGNIASYVTSGVDVTARYRLDPANFGVEANIGVLDLSLVANHLRELVFIEADGAAPNNRLGGLEAPKWQTSFDATWRMNEWTVNYGWNWFDKTRRYSRATMEASPNIAPPAYMYYNAKSSHDLQVRYQADERFTLYAGVNNLTDQRPDPNSFDYPISAMGRFFYVGLNARMATIGELFGR